MSSDYARSVFINCPFDDEYQEMFAALLFAVLDCGFKAKCALEIAGSGANRIDKIENLIEQCCLGIHDLSRTELDSQSGLPRFNMPLELGLYLGAKRYGDKRQRRKDLLVLDCEKYQYQRFCSDISGKDIAAHGGKPQHAIKAIRDWLQSTHPTPQKLLPSGSVLFERFGMFQDDLPAICLEERLNETELTFLDWLNVIGIWIAENPLDPSQHAQAAR